MHDALANKGKVNYDPYTPDQQYELQKIAESFLKGEREEIEELSSMRQVKELLAQMRNSFRKLKQDGKNFLEMEMVGPKSAASEHDDGRRTPYDGKGVGEVAEIGEFGLGVAPRDSRPQHKIEFSKEKEAAIREAQAYEPDEV